MRMRTPQRLAARIACSISSSTQPMIVGTSQHVGELLKQDRLANRSRCSGGRNSQQHAIAIGIQWCVDVSQMLMSLPVQMMQKRENQRQPIRESRSAVIDRQAWVLRQILDDIGGVQVGQSSRAGHRSDRQSYPPSKRTPWHCQVWAKFCNGRFGRITTQYKGHDR